MAINSNPITLGEARRAVRLELDKDGIYSRPSFIDEEIDYFLQKAYTSLVNRKISGNNTLGKGLEQNQKRFDDLTPLQVTENYHSPAIGTQNRLNVNTDIFGRPYSYIVLNGDYHGMVSTHVSIYPVAVEEPYPDWYKCWKDDSNGGKASIPTTTIESKLEELDDLYNRTLTDFRLRNGIGKPIEVMASETWDNAGSKTVERSIRFYGDPEHYRVNNATIVYIKTPKLPTTANDEFEVNWVNEIISLAASYALDNIESVRTTQHYQLNTQLAE